MKVYLHINYFEQGCDLVAALKTAKELGAEGVEFRRAPLGSHKKDDAGYLDVLARAWDQYSIPEISFGAPGPNLTSSDAGGREAELEAARSFYIQAAKRFPVKVINLLLGELINPDQSVPLSRFSQQGSFLATPEHWQWAAEGCRMLAETAESCHMRFALETHGIYLHDTVEAACKLVKQVDRPGEIGVLWDRANEFLFDEMPDMAASHEGCRPFLFYVHLKNILRYPSGGYRICGLPDGEIDIRQQLRLLREGGYDGPLCIESPRPGDRLHFLKEDLCYLNEVLLEEGGTE